MPIITMAHHNSLLGNYDGEFTYPNTPGASSQVIPNYANQPQFINKFYTKTSNGTLSGALAVVNSGWMPSIGPIDYSVNPDKKEFWIRRCAIIKVGYRSYEYHRDTHLGYFYVSDGSGKLTKSLQIYFDSAANLAFRALATDGTTVQYSGTIAKFDKWCICNASWECFIDIRINIDPVAGFIQCYDLNGNLAGEYLGPTHRAEKPTHIGVTTVFKMWTDNYSRSDYISSYTPFALAADEATFGMYVTPLLCKANGRKQEQTTGDYNKHKYLLPLPKRTDAVSMLLDSASPKQYTALIQSMSDATIPDTHEIKAFQFAGLFDTDVGTPTKVETSLTMCDVNGTFIEDTKKQLVVNAQSDLSYNYQRHWSKIHNVSPFTGTSWTKAELAGIEIGFTAYPPVALV